MRKNDFIGFAFHGLRGVWGKEVLFASLQVARRTEK
jgi:hypothetical protein